MKTGDLVHIANMARISEKDGSVSFIGKVSVDTKEVAIRLIELGTAILAAPLDTKRGVPMTDIARITDMCEKDGFKPVIAAIESNIIACQLVRTRGNQTEASDKLHINRTTLRHRLSTSGLPEVY